MRFKNTASFNRCKICDFSFQAPKSEFYQGLSFDQSEHWVNKVTDTPECKHCATFVDYSDIDNVYLSDKERYEQEQIEIANLVDSDFDE